MARYGLFSQNSGTFISNQNIALRAIQGGLDDPPDQPLNLSISRQGRVCLNILGPKSVGGI